MFNLVLCKDTPEVIFSGSYEDCKQKAYNLHDSGIDDDFLIQDSIHSFKMSCHTLEKVECPICGKDSRLYDMLLTHDCHCIPYRKVCRSCYDRVMGGRGFDGEEYTEVDENLNYDY